jgi:hypothetical protein
MFTISHRLANADFRASRRVPLSDFGLPCGRLQFPRSKWRLFVHVGTSVRALSRAVSPRFAARGLKPSCLIASYRLTWRSSGTGQKLRFCPVPEL